MSCQLAEWSSLGGLELAADEVAAIARSDAFELRPDPAARGRWRLTAKQFVGMARFGSLEVRVVPKLPVHRLVELLCSTLGRVRWQDEDTVWSDSDDLLATVAGTFVQQAERALRLGIIQGYRTVDDRLLAVRGRIAIGRQLARNPGLPIPVEVTYDDFTTDVVENQLLAGAGRVLLQLPGVPASLRSRLRRVEYQLIDVAPTSPSPLPPSVEWTRLNDRYRPAVTLARLVLSGCALEDAADRERAGGSFLVDMNQVFEDIVGSGIRDALVQDALTVDLQAVEYLDERRTMRIRPDVLVRRERVPVAVADVKYKSADGGVATGDVFQALAYAERYGLDRATLIHASPPPVAVLSVGTRRIDLQWIDLAIPPPARTAAIERCARSLVTTGSSRPAARR